MTSSAHRTSTCCTTPASAWQAGVAGVEPRWAAGPRRPAHRPRRPSRPPRYSGRASPWRARPAVCGTGSRAGRLGHPVPVDLRGQRKRDRRHRQRGATRIFPRDGRRSGGDLPEWRSWATRALARRQASGSAIVATTTAASGPGGGPRCSASTRPGISPSATGATPSGPYPGAQSGAINPVAGPDGRGPSGKRQRTDGERLFHIGGHGTLMVTSSAGHGWRPRRSDPGSGRDRRLNFSSPPGLTAASGASSSPTAAADWPRRPRNGPAAGGPSPATGTPAPATSLAAANYLLPSSALAGLFCLAASRRPGHRPGRGGLAGTAPPGRPRPSLALAVCRGRPAAANCTRGRSGTGAERQRRGRPAYGRPPCSGLRSDVRGHRHALRRNASPVRPPRSARPAPLACPPPRSHGVLQPHGRARLAGTTS